MPKSPQNPESTTMSVDEAIIKAGLSCIVKDGVRRTTMAGIARAAQVSRPTLYRRYKDVTALATALLTRELLDILDTVPRMPSDTEELVNTIVIYTDKARNNAFLRAIIETDPELLTTYSFRRFGQSQIALIRYLETLIKQVQVSDVARAHGEEPEAALLIRQDDPHVMATMILVITQAAALSAQAASSGFGSDDVWRAELTKTLKGYLSHDLTGSSRTIS